MRAAGWVACVAAFAAGCEGGGHVTRRHARMSALDAPPAFAAAESLRLDGRTKEAAPRFRALRDSFAAAHDTASWWRAQLWLADALLRLGERDSAVAALASATWLAGVHPERLGLTHHVRSIFLDRAGRLDSALVEASMAQAIARSTGDKRLEARTFSAMGRIFSLSGRYREALLANQRAFALEHEYPASAREIAVELNELGIDYRHLGRLSDAVAVYDSALAINRRLGSPEAIARVEFNLGNIRIAAGEPEAALALFNDALARAEQGGELRGIAFVHGGLGDLYTRAHAYGPAREHLEKALAINRAAKLPYGEVQNLEGIGRIALAQHGLSESLAALRSALAVADSMRFGKERATVRAGLARAAAAAGRGTAARRWARQAMHIADSLGDPAAQVEARTAFGVTLEAAHDSAAPAAFLSAIDLLETWRGRLALGDLRMGVAAPQTEAYEGAVRTLVARRRPDAALQVAERARARLLLELMAEHDVRDRQRSGEERVRERLRERFASRADARGEYAVRADREIDSLTRVLDRVQETVRANDVRAGITYPLPASTAELRAGLLSPGRALMMFFWGERDVYGWRVTRDSTAAARLGDADSLGALVDFLRGSLSDAHAGAPHWTSVARGAYERLVAPLVAPGERAAPAELFVVVDGPLAYVPLEVLIPDGGDVPWGARAKFTYGPSASVLLALTRASWPTSWPRAVLAMGDPLGAPGAASAAWGGGRAADLPPLPGAAAEAASIATLLGGDALTGKSATVSGWLALNPARYRYLHFATHAVVNDARPERTALILADRPLAVDAVRRLRIRAELVTLSACETGLGRQLRGEGIVGLPHAFLAAGARGVVVTLWRVDDEAAAQYMTELYRELRDGRSVAEAMLRVRQARLRVGGAAADPGRWAPFVLIGG